VCGAARTETRLNNWFWISSNTFHNYVSFVLLTYICVNAIFLTSFSNKISFPFRVFPSTPQVQTKPPFAVSHLFRPRHKSRQSHPLQSATFPVHATSLDKAALCSQPPFPSTPQFQTKPPSAVSHLFRPRHKSRQSRPLQSASFTSASWLAPYFATWNQQYPEFSAATDITQNNKIISTKYMKLADCVWIRCIDRKNGHKSL